MKLVAAVLLLAALPLAACSPSMVVKDSAPAAGKETGKGRHGAFVVGGRVKGLEGIGLVLRSSLGQEIQVEDDGRFVFRTTLENGAEFSVSVAREPISPAQSCVVEHAAGKIAGKNALETTIVCSAVSFNDTPAAIAIAVNDR